MVWEFFLNLPLAKILVAGAPEAKAVGLLDLLDETAAVDVGWVGPDRFASAKMIFRRHRDQRFSFTDCTSFVVMRERGIREVLTTDGDFPIAGFEPLLVRSSKRG